MSASQDAAAFSSDKDSYWGSGDRRLEAAGVKISAAKRNLRESYNLRKQKTNRDDRRYSSENFYASFTKTLPSNQFGEVEPAAYRALRRAVKKGESSAFDSIPLDPTAARRLANPQGAFRFPLIGLDSHSTRINRSFTFRSADIAGEMAEVYWQAITRDVPFIDYDVNPLIADAVSDLGSMSAPPGVAANGSISPQTIFRGETAGDLIGPYISQFLWQDFNFGPVEVTQRYELGNAGVDYMLDTANWLNIQRGGAPLESATFDSVKRYIHSNRGLGEYVHRDVSFQAYLHAALILLSYGGDAQDPGNPYLNDITNQGGFTSLGGPFVLDMVTKAANLSLSGAWFQKWTHRFLRPETLAGRVNFHLAGQRSYELHPDLLNSQSVDYLLAANGNAFLPMSYIEGSPTHPSYPAGHATIAGACVTVLKAFFNEDFVIPAPVEADATGENLLAYTGADLTVGDELNKLANNIAIGRDAAGVHYRQDGIQGLDAGEQQAISLLQDYTTTLNEDGFDGFSLTKFDGSPITIRKGKVFNY